MYDFVDQPVTSLDRGGRFLIWSLRSWVKAVTERQCPPSTVGPAFAKWGVIGALPHFHKFMVILGRHGLLAFQFQPLGCGKISESEAILLELIRSLRQARPTQSKSTLDLLVEEEAVPSLLVATIAMADVLSKAGLVPGSPRNPAAQT